MKGKSQGTVIALLVFPSQHFLHGPSSLMALSDTGEGVLSECQIQEYTKCSFRVPNKRWSRGVTAPCLLTVISGDSPFFSVLISPNGPSKGPSEFILCLLLSPTS